MLAEMVAAQREPLLVRVRPRAALHGFSVERIRHVSAVCLRARGLRVDW